VNHESIKIPQASGIDYTDHREVYAYHHLFGMTLQCNGGFTDPVLRNIETEGRTWLKGVERIFRETLSPESGREKECGVLFPDLINAYDFIHRICRDYAPSDYLAKVRMLTVGRWLAGDGSISKTDAALMIWSQMTADSRSVDRKYRMFYFDVADRWIRELLRYGHFRDVLAAETYRRLTHLLRSDLYAYLSRQDAAKTKTRWIKTHWIDDPSTLDTPTLRAYITFAHTATTNTVTSGSLPVTSGNLPVQDADTLNRALITELITRPDLHPFDRQAYHMSMESREP